MSTLRAYDPKVHRRESDADPLSFHPDDEDRSWPDEPESLSPKPIGRTVRPRIIAPEPIFKPRVTIDPITNVASLNAGSGSSTESSLAVDSTTTEPYHALKADVDEVELEKAGTHWPLSDSRWWVLFVFCFLSSNQSLIWITYSPITNSTETYYNISKSTVDLLLNWGPIFFLPAVVVIAKMTRTAEGLRRVLLATAWLCFLSCILRLIPEAPHFLEAKFDDQGNYGLQNWLPHSSAIYFLHVAQILNSFMGPMCMAPIAKLSCIWFAADERTFATSIAFISMFCGSAIGFLIGPALVQNPEDMPKYLLVQAGFSLAALICAVAYLPARPLHYPSPAAEELDQTEPPPFLPSLVTAVTNRPLVLLCLSNGCLNGVFSLFLSVLSTILTDSSDSYCGWLSFASSMATVVAGLVMGRLALAPSLRRHLKLLSIISSAFTTVFLLWFAGSNENIFTSDHLPTSSTAILMSLILAGFASGGSNPIAYELAAELTFPLPESVSGGLLSGVNNAAGMIFLFVAPHLSASTICAVVVGVSLICTLLLIPIEEEYLRMDEEDRLGINEPYAPPPPAASSADDDPPKPVRKSTRVAFPVEPIVDLDLSQPLRPQYETIMIRAPTAAEQVTVGVTTSRKASMVTYPTI